MGLNFLVFVSFTIFICVFLHQMQYILGQYMISDVAPVFTFFRKSAYKCLGYISNTKLT